MTRITESKIKILLVGNGQSRLIDVQKGLNIMAKKVTIQERGWAGHFICAQSCRFRRNTLITCGDTRIVVSTVGCMEDNLRGKGFAQIGCDRYYETMAFHSDPKDTRYYDADVSREVSFDSPWAISVLDADDKANDMHDAVVSELVDKLKNGVKL